MNPATGVVSGENARTPAEDFVSLEAGWCWAAGAATFALPLVKWWRITNDADGVVAFTALIVAFSWWLGRALQETPPRTTVGAAVTGLLVLGGGLWLLAWLRVEDFGVLRWGWFALAVSLTLVLWGWPGPARAFRPLLAVVAWALLPPGMLPFLESPAWLCESTASIAGFLLWQQQDAAVIQGATIHLPTGSVLVGGGCTVVPLWLSLAHLFVPAWLIFQLSLRRAVVIAAVVAVIAFVLSIVRVMIMAVVVGDAERFHYWHGPTGASWFTAAGMLAMAGLIDRALRGRTERTNPVTLARGQAWTLGGLAVVSMLAAGVVAWVRFGEPPPPPSTTPELPRFRLTQVAEAKLPDWQLANARYPFVWERRAIYEASLSRQTISVRLCYAPCLLDGDPLSAAWHYPWFARPAGEAGWVRQAVGENLFVREAATAGRCSWIVTLPAEAGPVADAAAWQAAGAARMRHPGTWWRWLAGRAPLRDKRAHWLEITWTGTGAPPVNELRAALAAWTALAQDNVRADR